MRRLIDFFNHGTLPFTGRSRESERLTEFWNGAAEGQGLRAAIVMGEAGVGKSRLLEEVLPRITSVGGIVVHVKLYPGSATALAPLLARAVWFSSAGRSLVRAEPESTIDSAAAALRRLARLRPTLLVIEDIHLMDEASLSDFSAVLEGIAHESIAMLCLSRPGTVAARPVLERYLVDEIELHGFTRPDLETVWHELFDMTAPIEVADLVHRVTLGNPLALRSALRGLLKSGAVARNDAGAWRITVSIERLEELLRSNVQILSEGMASHLSERERRIAERLACLGEVFARRTAIELLRDDPKGLEILSFKGVVAQSGASPAPIYGTAAGSTPMAFTHTLVHRYFADSAEIDPDELLRLAHTGLPLYSILPFQILAESGALITSTPTEVRALIDGLTSAIHLLNDTPDWKLGMELLEAVEQLHGRYPHGWPDDEEREIRVRLLNCRLALLKRNSYGDEYRAALARQLELTDGELPPNLSAFRIDALAYAYVRPDNKTRSAILREADTLIERYPNLRFTSSYVRFLGAVATNQTADREDRPSSYTRPRLDALLSAPELPDELRRLALREVAPLFLWSFTSAEELHDRLRLLAELEAMGEGDTVTIRTRKIALFIGLGRMRDAVRLIDELLPQLRDRGLHGHVIQCRLLRLYALGALGMDLDALLDDVERLYRQTAEQILPKVRLSAGLRMIRLGLLRDDPAWTRRIVESYPETLTNLDTNERLLLAASREERLEIAGELVEHAPSQDASRLVSSAARMPAQDLEWHEHSPYVAAFRALLSRPPLTTTTLITLRASIETLLAITDGDDERVRLVAPAVCQGLNQALEWLAERELIPYMAPLIDRYQGFFAPREVGQWRERIEEIRRRGATTETKPSPIAKLRLSMIGSIEVERPGEERTRIRGARLRTLLGLMTIDAMLKEPLSYREFCRLAASGEDDPEKARKTMSMGILRLREALGQEAVITSGETPRLNPDYVDVDLLEADELLKEAARALRGGTLVRAFAPLLRALELTLGEVPFPGLYDTFFEAAREEFEIRVRTTLVEVAEGLLMEGDPAGAERLLAHGFAMMPEDEEITELLRRALDMQGKKLEAERIRIKAMAM